MESQGVEEALERVHAHQHAKGEREEQKEQEEKQDRAACSLGLETHLQHLLKEH